MSWWWEEEDSDVLHSLFTDTQIDIDMLNTVSKLKDLILSIACIIYTNNKQLKTNL